VTLEGGGNSDASQLTRQTVPGIRYRHRKRTLTESREYTWNVVGLVSVFLPNVGGHGLVDV